MKGASSRNRSADCRSALALPAAITLPAQTDVPAAGTRHARHDGAKHRLAAAPAPEIPGQPDGHRVNAGVLPGVDDLAFISSSGTITRPVIGSCRSPRWGPAWQLPGPAGDVEHGTGQYGDAGHADDDEHGPAVGDTAHGASARAQAVSSSRMHSKTATAIATRILSLSGSANAATAAAPATASRHHAQPARRQRTHDAQQCQAARKTQGPAGRDDVRQRHPQHTEADPAQPVDQAVARQVGLLRLYLRGSVLVCG